MTVQGQASGATGHQGGEVLEKLVTLTIDDVEEIGRAHV